MKANKLKINTIHIRSDWNQCISKNYEKMKYRYYEHSKKNENGYKQLEFLKQTGELIMSRYTILFNARSKSKKVLQAIRFYEKNIKQQFEYDTDVIDFISICNI